MSQFVLICERTRGEARGAGLAACAALLRPPGFAPPPEQIVEADGLSLLVTSPSDAVRLRGANLCLGTILDEPGEWWRVDAPAPDGTYALLRCAIRAVQVVTDLAASRCVWYYHDDEVFIAASAQRPIIALLGSFELEPSAPAWMVTSGSLGPLPSYDRRLRRVPPDGVLTLDRAAWRLSVRASWDYYQTDDLSDDEHARRLNDAVVHTCGYLGDQAARWPVLLSGGYDSRTLLVGLMQTGAQPVNSVTWGLQAALRDEQSDAVVARHLADSVGAARQFFSLDPRPGQVAEALSRFVALGEGQLPDFTMYADGFATWQSLAEQGCLGVVRGDNHGWGYLGEFSSEMNVRHHCGADLLSDFAGGHVIQRLGLAPQHWPAELRRRPDEPLLAYRDRLQHGLFIPARISPLNQLKAPFVEIVNPLQARRVADVVARLPERLRLHPGALALLLQRQGPAVPFATHAAATLASGHRRPRGARGLAHGLRGATASRLFDQRGREEVVRALLEPPPAHSRRGARRAVRALVPRRLMNAAMPMVGLRLDTTDLAVRMFVAARAVELFEHDARTPAATSPPLLAR